jgi:hypothetical protein
VGRAGAHWRSHATHGDCNEARWDRETFVRWKEIVAEEEAAKREGREVKESGLGVCFYHSSGYNS